MRIAFHTGDPACLEASLPLARQLAGRGHDIIYSTSLALRSRVLACGLPCAPVHRDIWRVREPAAPLDGWGELERAQRITDEYLRGDLDAHVRALAPAVIVADALADSPLQLVAHAHGIPCVQLSATLSRRFDHRAPLGSPLLPSATPLQLASARWLASCLNRTAAPWSPMLVSALAHRYAERFGYPAAEVSFEAEIGPALTAHPELIAAEAAIDFPGACDHFLAVPAEPEPGEPDPELSAFAGWAGERRVVVADAGALDDAAARRWCGAVMEAARRSPERAFVVVSAAPPQPAAPPNVLHRAAAPRAWLLAHAAALVTPCELRAVREAIAARVPIVAIPHERDQPGNAARVAHHGIGVRLPALGGTPASLAAAIDRASGDPQIAARLAALDEACRREHAEHRGIAWIERAAAAAGPPAVRPPPPSPLPDEPAAAAARTAWLWLDPTDEAARRLDLDGELSDDRPGDLEVGGAGITACPALGDALACGTGARLVRVEAIGPVAASHGGRYLTARRLRRTFQADAPALLEAHAARCARAALDHIAAASPERAERIGELVAQQRARRAEGAPAHVLDEHLRELFAYARTGWHDGYGAPALAVAGDPARGARMARLEVAALLGGASADRYRAALATLDRALDADVAALVTGWPRPA